MRCASDKRPDRYRAEAITAPAKPHRRPKDIRVTIRKIVGNGGED